MGEGFKKLKRKYWQSAIIKSAVCGLSFGLFVFGAVLIALKLAGIPLDLVYYILIAVGSALLCGGICVLIFKPTDKKVAIELDKRHNLDEKVQSALQFNGVQGPVVEMLETDTEARLLVLPAVTFTFATVCKLIVICLLSAAIFVSSLFVPSNIAEGGTGGGSNTTDDGSGDDTVIDPEYHFSDDELEALLYLIEDVKKSNLEENIKNSTVDSINKLINNLEFAEYESEKISFINNTLKNVEKTIVDSLSFKAIANALGRNYVGPLAQMIADGVQVAYANYAIIEYTDVEKFDAEKEDKVLEAISEALDEFFDMLMNIEEDSDEDEPQIFATRDGEEGEPSEGEEGEDPSDDEEEEPLNFVAKTYTNIYTALLFSEVHEEDSLYSVIYSFASNLAKSGDVLTNPIALGFEMMFKKVLANQAYRLAMNKFVSIRLKDIFELDILPEEIFKPEILEEEEDGEGPKGPTQGGYGKGDMLYGSDDLVYDPATDKYVPYGELFNDYYAMVEAMLREGNLTEEQQAIIRAYFQILFSGLPEDDKTDDDLKEE